jgi:hypothetical protein
MTERRAYIWNWILGIGIVVICIWGIGLEIKHPTVYKNDTIDTNTFLIIIHKVNTGKEIRFRYPQDSAKAKTDSTVYKLFNAVGKSIGDAVKK